MNKNYIDILFIKQLEDALRMAIKPPENGRSTWTITPSKVAPNILKLFAPIIAELQDKLHRRNMQIKELKKNKKELEVLYGEAMYYLNTKGLYQDFKNCREKRINLDYCNADFYCSVGGYTSETKGCMTCEFYNR